MSIGHEAMHAPQYMPRFLFTTSWMRLPKILSLIGRAFQPSPSTVDFRGVVCGVGSVVVGFGAVCPDVSYSSFWRTCDAPPIVSTLNTYLSSFFTGGLESLSGLQTRRSRVYSAISYSTVSSNANSGQ
jgi:hypothetical protein